MSSAIVFNLDQSKILLSCNGLTCHQMTKFLDLSILKAFADDKSNIASNLKFNLERVENIEKKGENAGYLHFLLFLQGFQKERFLKAFYLKIKVVKSIDCVVKS